uniref:Uncharacterized protein n=1 Tax=viral metagenome TaxID=1070528 RepID=A0A6C0KW97_9ZZZZ
MKDLKDSKICLIYAYYERKNQEKNQTNLSFFINYGLDKSKWLNLDITTVFVINSTQCSVKIPKRNDIHVIYNDSNEYSDYEGWHDGIIYLCKLNNQSLWKTYDYMCLINSGPCGPIMDEDINNHWLYPFYEKMKLTSSIACSPYINLFEPQFLKTDIPIKILSCYFTLIKISKNIMDLLMRTRLNNMYTVLGHKKTKLDAINYGEYGLSEILLMNKYNLCSLFDDGTPASLERKEFIHPTNITRLIKTIFIKNIWRISQPPYYVSLPVLYSYCKNFIKKKLLYKNIFHDFEIEYNYKLLNLDNFFENKTQYYKLYGYAEENILFPVKGTIITNSCVIYAHYDENNIIANYVLEGLKTLIFLGYDILFYTASEKIINIDLSILPFDVNFIKNEGAGTDWKIFLKGLQKIKNENINYDWIMIMNDSLLFPINGINNFINTITNMRSSCDFWGHWESNEINWHLIGVPIEFKSIMLNCVLKFIEENIEKCTFYMDYITILETKLAEFLKTSGYKHNSVIKDTDLISNDNLICKTFHPYVISQWINNPKSFSIKWKYCISYLNNKFVSGYFNFLSKYLHYGPNGFISKPEDAGAFPKSEITHKLFI